jgi:hypothetical protein
MSGRRTRAVVGALAWSITLAAALTAQTGGRGTSPAAGQAPDKNPYARLAAPWPDADGMRKRQLDAEQLPLFATDEPLALTITADFKAINRDRNPNSTKRFPGTIALPGAGAATIPVQLGTRGNVRLNARTCDFAPLRVDFVRRAAQGAAPAAAGATAPGDKGALKGTAFEGQESLKLVTHCWASATFDQYLLREYLAYRIFNLHTPRSFRARRATVTYVDTATGRQVAARPGIFIEDDGDVAKRVGGRVVDLPRTQFSDLDPDATTTMAILQYMIGNTDYSIYVLHNVKLVQTPVPGRRLIPVVYDFDMSGLVNTHYAGVDPKLGIASVRDRLYRGPCRPLNEIEPLLAVFRAKHDEVLALYDTIPELNQGSRKDARSFLEDFYQTISRPDRVKKAFVDDCRDAPTM